MKIIWKSDNPNCKSLIVMVDDELWREVPKALFFRNLRSIKRCMNLKDLEQLFSQLEEKACYDQAVRLLSIRSHFSKELKRKLSERGFSSQAIDTALSTCESRSYLNDSKHVMSVINNEQRKGYGPDYISLKIKSLGNITSETFKNIMEEVESNQETIIDQLIAKRYKNTSWKDPKQKMKVFQSLKRRGFRSDAINRVLSRF
ncbi:MAG TPA: RecX family transcriptional regulator [Rhabdochlamydiaceae bacterium]|nr:RecX family transcriptional regulator [Rhabdochlamydiaceae bacterium]